MFEEGIYYNFGTRIFFMSAMRRMSGIIVGAIILFGISYLPKFMSATPALKGFLKVIKIETIEHVVKLTLLYGSIALVVIAIILIATEWINFNSRKFMLDRFALRIRSGLFSRSEVAIPYSEIQTVNLNESIMDRTYGTASMFILTAGSENKGEESSGSFQIIDSKIARALQEELLRRSSDREPMTYEPSLAKTEA